MTAWQPLIAQADTPIAQLTVSGAVVMLLSVGLVLALSGFCFWKILTEPQPSEHHHAPLEVDTHDLDSG